MKPTINKHCLAAAAALLAWGAVASASAATVFVNSLLSTSEVWVASNEYVLTNLTYVASGSTLTIQPGTVVRGQADSTTPGANNPGALIVTRGSKLIANGTAASPIVFTDEFDDNVPPAWSPAVGGGYDVWPQYQNGWGGVIVLGKTYVAFNTSTGPNSARSVQVEGVPAVPGLTEYGGGDDDDSSGSLSYISIRYGGTGLAPNNEINGLTLGGVGRGTTLHHIEVMNNLDDGYEWFGGTVNASYLVAYAAGDDSFDSDEGYRGKGQFWLAVQGDAGGSSVGSGISDKGFEMDGGNSPDSSQPYALSRVYNVTMVGKGQSGGGGTYTDKAKNDAMHIKDNAGPQFYNCLFLDFGGAGTVIEGEGGDAATNSRQRYTTAYNSFPTDSVSTNPASYYYKAQTEGFQCDIRDNVFWQFGGPLSAVTSNEVVTAGGVTGSSTHPNVFSENLRGGSLTGTNYNNVVAGSLPITTLTRSGVAAANRMFNVSAIDPRPLTNSVAMTVTRMAPADGFFQPVGYKGAFTPTCNWLQDWTAMSRLGLTPSSSCPASPAAAPDISVQGGSDTRITIDTDPGVVYLVEISTDLINWSSYTSVIGDGSIIEVQDPNPLADRLFYRVSTL
jgi:hypothetical protein